MRLALASDGNPRGHGTWSGTTHNILDQLALAGNEILAVDVSLRGASRWLAAAATFSPSRERWRARYTLETVPFRLRSLRGARVLRGLSARPDFGLQIGATFDAFREARLPYFLCCDSNIKVAISGGMTGFSHASVLSEAELRRVIAREAGVYGRAAGIFTLSEHLRQSFLQDFGLPIERVHCIYAGPNFDLASVPPEGSGDRSPGDSANVLFVGAQFGRKGGDTLLAAFHEVRARLPAARLIIVGPERAPTDAPGVEYLGFLRKDRPAEWAELVRAYRRADVFCLPTRFEPFGVAFIEAMHFGLPCIGTNTNAVPEIIVDGETGFLVPVDDVSAIVARLLVLLGDQQLRRRMGAAGRARAQELFTWQRVGARILGAMRPALETG